MPQLKRYLFVDARPVENGGLPCQWVIVRGLIRPSRWAGSGPVLVGDVIERGPDPRSRREAPGEAGVQRPFVCSRPKRHQLDVIRLNRLYFSLDNILTLECNRDMSTHTVTTETKEIYRWIPKSENTRTIEHPLGVAYIYESVNRSGLTTYNAVAYTAKASKATFHESYGREAARDKRVADFFRGLEQREQLKSERRAARSAPHSLKVGDILHHSWGWEQTNCDYYQIVAVTEHSAIIREIGSETVEGSTLQHGMADRRMPVADKFYGEPITVRVSGDNYINPSKGELSRGSISKWDGRPNYCSWYA